MFGSMCGFLDTSFFVWVWSCPSCPNWFNCSSSFLIFLLNIHLTIKAKM